MKALLQRVRKASVHVGEDMVGEISQGLVIFIGVAMEDTEKDASVLVDKIVNMRLFSDAEGKFNLSAIHTKAELLLVSQFTLLADTGLKVATGRFQQYMLVDIQNDGPVTFMLDSRTWVA